MRRFVDYLKDYFRSISPNNFFLTFIFVAMLIAVNYTVGIEYRIRNLSPWPVALLVFFLFYLSAYGIAWSLQGFSSSLEDGFPGFRLSRLRSRDKKSFVGMLMLASLFFSLKMIHWDPGLADPGPWNRYWLLVLQLPVKLAVMVILLYTCWQLGKPASGMANATGEARAPDRLSFYGFTTRNFSALPYFQILLLLVPLVAMASTQHDFLSVYPKVKNISFLNGYAQPLWPWRLLYEISYGLDFVSIELFFRGFLVLGFLRFGGIHTILPMAAFYCTIHFGKPLGECISSFFGGLALGVIAWRSRTILGGLIVHLGLAWMMEIGGWIGNGY